MFDHEHLIQIISLIGAIIVLSAYVGHQLHIQIFNPENYFYNVCNFIAGLLLTYAAVETFQLGFILMESVWGLVSGFTIFRVYLKKRHKEKK